MNTQSLLVDLAYISLSVSFLWSVGCWLTCDALKKINPNRWSGKRKKHATKKDYCIFNSWRYGGSILITIAFILSGCLTWWISNQIEKKVYSVVCKGTSSEKDCPLKVEVYPFHDIPHDKGLTFDGITWQDTDTDIRISLTNKTPMKLYNVNFIIKSETVVRKAVQATTIPGITINPYPEGHVGVTMVDKKGEHHFYASQAGSAFSQGYKLQAGELVGTGRIEVVLACVAPNPVVNGIFPKTLLAPRRLPKWFRINGTYETNEAGYHKRYQFNDTPTLRLQ